MKYLSLIIVFFLILTGCTGDQETNTIKIGAIPSLSGAAGEQGKNWLQGAELALDQANQQPASEPKQFQLIVEDDQTQPAKVVAAMSKLCQVDRVAGVIGGTWDFLGEAAYPLAEKHRIPFVTPSNPVEVISEKAKQSGFVFSSGLSLGAMKAAFDSFVDSEKARGQRVERIGIVYPDLPFGLQQATMIQQSIAEKQLKVAFTYAFPPASLMSDTVKLAAQKILSEKPDLTYMVLDYNGLDLLTKEFVGLKIQPKVITTQHLDQAFLFSKDPARYKNLYAIYPVEPEESFRNAFEAKFHTPPRVYAYEGYLAARFLIRIALGWQKLPQDTQQILPDEQTHSQARIMTTDSGEFAAYEPS
jgi:ABC-type branched-subunit amino acid transport system substrate-binding protein